jgi:hypothetical protein
VLLCGAKTAVDPDPILARFEQSAKCGRQPSPGRKRRSGPRSLRRAGSSVRLSAGCRVGEVVEALEGAGLAVATVTGGGTGTYRYEAASGAFSEVQPGSFIFGDADYARNFSEAGEQVPAALSRTRQTLNPKPPCARAHPTGRGPP